VQQEEQEVGRKEGLLEQRALRTYAARQVCVYRTRAFSKRVPNSVASVGGVRRAMADAAEVKMIE
jgi:hypothetical protein